MQLDYTAIIPNDRFEKPVDRDDDVTQEESYVVVCVCGRNVFVWGSQLDRQDKNPSQFVCLQQFYFGDSRWAGQCCSSRNLFMKFVIQKKIMCTHCKDDIERKKIKISMNFNLLESIMTSTHY